MRKNIIFPLVVFSVSSVIYLFPLFRSMEYLGQMDWDQFTFWNAVPREIILRYRQFPLWNPFSNGGNVSLALPHVSFLSPSYVLVLLFGPVVGIKLQIIVHLIIGMMGMFCLCRYIKLNYVSSYLPPFVYMLSSVFSLHMAEGHLEWLSMSFVPWIFLVFLKSLDNRKYITFGIILLSLVILGGSVYITSIAVVMLSSYAFLTAIKARRIMPLATLGFLFVGTFLLSSVKLFPMLEFLKDNPRKIASNESVKTSIVPLALFSREQADYYQNTKWTNPEKKIRYRGEEFEYGWHEYGAYIGFLPFILAVLGVLVYFKQFWVFFITGSICLWISLGRGTCYSLWDLVHKLPIYDSLHAPSRFILGSVFVISIFSGLGLSKIESLIKKNYIKILVPVVIIFVFYDLSSISRPLWNNVFNLKPPQIAKYSTFKQRFRDYNLWMGSSRSSMYPALLSNSGVLNSYEVLGVQKGDVKIFGESGYRGEVYLINNKDGNLIKSFHFTPNIIKVDLELSQSDTLIINQNFYRGWRIKGIDKKLQAYNGLISVVLPRGEYSLTFYYLPGTFIAGSFISILTLVFICLFSNIDKESSALSLSHKRLLK